MKRNYFILLFFFFCNTLLFAQKHDCESIISFLNEKESQIAHLNLHDPDYIPLHYFVVQDIMKELKQFRNDVIPNYTECETIPFRELVAKYNELNSSVQSKYDSLVWLNKNVYLLFYEKAIFEYQLKDEEEGNYCIERSLQYCATFPNAILLKLRKLLDKNYFQECLSLLNTLYYDTEMDDEQEKQAIEFTDIFYDKLYKTGDSLVKIEHAAEALELFEVLEVFCLNLPTTYCNDDYYHGVLRSKSGIYESYLAIAKVAEKRGNSQIAAHFYQYAQEYLNNNPHLKNYEPKPEPLIAENRIYSDLSERQKAEVGAKEKGEKEKGDGKKEKYDNMVLQALALCIKEDFSASYKMFLEAKKLEDCHCFETDFRVDLMINELSKIID